jgi:hypothetical protein
MMTDAELQHLHRMLALQRHALVQILSKVAEEWMAAVDAEFTEREGDAP